MNNGHDTQQQMNINPVQAAAFALGFLENVQHTRAQREAYDIAVAMLQAIANGQVMLAPPPPPMPLAVPQSETAQ